MIDCNEFVVSSVVPNTVYYFSLIYAVALMLYIQQHKLRITTIDLKNSV